MIQVIGLIAALCIVACYLWSEHTGNSRPFAWANVVGGMVLLPVNLYYGTYFGALLTVSFSCIAVYGLLHESHSSSG